MHKIKIRLLLVILSFFIGFSCAETNDRPITPGTPSEIPLRLKKIMPDLYLITGRGANVVVRRTPEGLFLIDNKVQYNIVWRELNELIKEKISTQPIRYAFITHHHADHGGNNQRVIDSGAELIGHKNIVDILQTYKSIIAPVNPAPPTITFTEKYTVKIADVEAIAYYWGPGHTNADIAIYFPDQKVVAVADMLYINGEPAVDGLDGHGSLFGMLQRIDDLLGLEFELAIPGRGDNVFTRQEVILYRDRLAELIRRGQQAIKQGATEETWVDTVQPYDLGFRLVGHFWTSPKHFAPIYRELSDSVKGQ